MIQLKRWFGALSIGVGLAGVVLSVFCAVMLWRFESVVSKRAIEFADLALTVKQNADEYIVQAESVLGNVQQKVGALKQYADTVSEDAAQNRKGAPIIQRLDAELIRELREARSILTSIQSGSNSLNEALKQFESLASPMRMFKKPDKTDGESDLAALSRSLTEVSELIQQVINFVTRMEQQGITDEQAQKMKQAVTQLGEVLDRGRLRLTSLQESLQNASTKVLEKREQVPRWANRTAIVCTVFFVCFGFTQIHLIGFGWSSVMSSRRSLVVQK